MNYQEFLEVIREHFEEVLGEDYKVALNEVMKNNCVKLNGLSILEHSADISPNIYLNSYYEKYLEGVPLEEIYQIIWGAYVAAISADEMQNFKLNLDLSFQSKRIFIKLINYERNKELLQFVPYIRFLDLAVTFHSLVTDSDKGISSIPISTKIFEKWEISKGELMRYGLNNSKKILPMTVKPMEEVLYHLMKEEFSEKLSDSEEAEKMFQEMKNACHGIEMGKGASMYVMSNYKGLNGAAVMLYEEAFKEFAGSVGSDLFILPSSIHELILIPYDEEINPDDLRQMVRDVNETHVPIEDVLSDQVYLYSVKKCNFQIAAN